MKKTEEKSAFENQCEIYLLNLVRTSDRLTISRENAQFRLEGLATEIDKDGLENLKMGKSLLVISVTCFSFILWFILQSVFPNHENLTTLATILVHSIVYVNSVQKRKDFIRQQVSIAKTIIEKHVI